MKTTEQSFFTVAELAGLLGVSKVTVLKKIKNRQIEAKKIGNSFLIGREEFEHLLSSEMSEIDKTRIKEAVKKTIKDYGEVLKWLGKE